MVENKTEQTAFNDFSGCVPGAFSEASPERRFPVSAQELLLLNIGNSNVELLRLERRDADGTERVLAFQSIPTEKFSLDSIPPETNIAASSVLPRFTEALRNRGAFQVNAETAGNAGIDLSQVDSTTLGADRIANCAAMKGRGEFPALCIDAGTAVDVELLDEAGRFIGGAILPGRLLMRKSLNLYTAQLPMIPFFDESPSFPAKNTVESLRWGSDGLLLAGIRDLIERVRVRFRKDPALYFCGGDAAFLKRCIPGGQRCTNYFTLSGINYIFRMNQTR